MKTVTDFNGQRIDVREGAQLDLTGWAYRAGRTLVLRGEPTTALFVLVTLAQVVEESLNSPRGYSDIFPSEVAIKVGLSTGTAQKYLRLLERLGLAVEARNCPGAWRLPDHVTNH